MSYASLNNSPIIPRIIMQHPALNASAKKINSRLFQLKSEFFRAFSSATNRVNAIMKTP